MQAVSPASGWPPGSEAEVDLGRRPGARRRPGAVALLHAAVEADEHGVGVLGVGDESSRAWRHRVDQVVGRLDAGPGHVGVRPSSGGAGRAGHRACRGRPWSSCRVADPSPAASTSPPSSPQAAASATTSSRGSRRRRACRMGGLLVGAAPLPPLHLTTARADSVPDDRQGGGVVAGADDEHQAVGADASRRRRSALSGSSQAGPRPAKTVTRKRSGSADDRPGRATSASRPGQGGVRVDAVAHLAGDGRQLRAEGGHDHRRRRVRRRKPPVPPSSPAQAWRSDADVLDQGGPPLGVVAGLVADGVLLGARRARSDRCRRRGRGAGGRRTRPAGWPPSGRPAPRPGWPGSAPAGRARPGR